MLLNDKRKVVLVIFLTLGLFIPLIFQLLLMFPTSSDMREDTFTQADKVAYIDLLEKQNNINKMEEHLEELNLIKLKSLSLLISLDSKRTSLLNEISETVSIKSSLDRDVKQLTKNYNKLKKDLEKAQVVISERIVTKVMNVGVPMQILEEVDHTKRIKNNTKCTLNDCFDFSKCSYIRSFKAFIYKPDFDVGLHGDLFNFADLDPKDPCVYIFFTDVSNSNNDLNQVIMTIPSWKNMGINHVLFLLGSHIDSPDNYCEIVDKLNTGFSIKVLSSPCKTFNLGYDFLVPRVESSNVTLSDILPLNRRYSLTVILQCYYEEHYKASVLKYFTHEVGVFILNLCIMSSECMHRYCGYNNAKVLNLLQNSKFFLISTLNNSQHITEIWHCLHHGVIPVIIGDTNQLPFADVLDWSQAAVLLPFARLPEVSFIIQTIDDNDISAMKIQGRFFFTTYFSNQYKVIQTVMEALKHRISIIPTLVSEYKPKVVLNISIPFDNEQNRGNVVSHFTQNFSYISKYSYRAWNTFPGGLNFYPTTPWSQPPPSLHQFLKEGRDFYVPIGDGKGGDGVAFSRSLGGDMPYEMFTIVMLTYDRQIVLMEALQRLSGIKYLHKVIIVWNHPKGPANDLVWPDIGIHIEVIKAERNSLNNRFLPYSSIKTDAVLSMDDDIYLRHDEIELAFRIWRENRDRLVGFPGRHHSYNSAKESFDYNSEHSCELSLVLTGGAFFHKYYSYVYTTQMDSSIRELVDEYTNCEDLAMNFLVAHITHKPPIKVTSRWTFRCPGCPAALSTDEDHYIERNKCMSAFEKVYGYNPLKRTQFRADSILFKTKIPSQFTKCFQFV